MGVLCASDRAGLGTEQALTLSWHLQGRTPCPGTAQPPLPEAELGMAGLGLGSRPDEMI